MAAGASAWSLVAQGVAPASAGTAKTVLSYISAANKSAKLTDVGVGFIGASGGAKPVLVELCTSTQATAGTSTSVTPNAIDTGNADTVTGSSAKAFSAEPTVLTVIKTWRVHPQASFGPLPLPLGREPRVNNGKAICLRVTFESGETTTNIDAYMEIEE